MKLFLFLGSLSAGLAVIVGAFGAHGLKHKIPAELMAVYQTGVQYHFYHALALMLVGIIGFHMEQTLVYKASGWLMFVGTMLFSGSLYVLALSGIKWLGAITPIGGLVWIMAWMCLAWALYTQH